MSDRLAVRGGDPTAFDAAHGGESVLADLRRHVVRRLVGR